MDQSRLQALIARGLALCGSITGGDYLQYRPTQAIDPIGSADPMATLTCAFDFSRDLSLETPTPPGRPFVLMLVDPGLVLAGDLLVGTETYFVSRVQVLQPAWCVLCNAVLGIVDTAAATTAGTNAYGGQISATDTVLASGWPANVLAKSRGEQDVTKLPSDTRAAYFEVCLPAMPGITIGIGLELQDQNGQSYTIMNAELTAYGWKLLAGLATT
ncbi:hypothetical protein [Lichenicoccus sp.]|uniref:hypothetical protein n=1 Tax=Lichenicoccus sp. TaxID=2781899 RepID=UPI003D0B26B4